MSLQKITVSKSELLDIVKDNKKKHDEIYEAAEAGFWLEAEETLKKQLKEQLTLYRKNYRKNVKDLKKQIANEMEAVREKKKDYYLSYFRKPFPENHSDDYQGTIRRLELSVEPRVELENTEFDCYVRNKWQWRNSFLNTNTFYANNAVSSSWSAQSISGSYAVTASYATSLKTF